MLKCAALLAYLNAYASVAEAKAGIGAWLVQYNLRRPHSAIGNQVPAVLHRSAGNPGQPAAR